MSELLPATKTLSEAWLEALTLTVNQPGGRCVHLVMTVEVPGSENEAIRHALDGVLDEAGKQSVGTVAGTIFPNSLYQSPGFSWSPDLVERAVEELDAAAHNLYQRYLNALPVLRVVWRGSAGKRARSLGISKLHVSASHESGWAVAIAVACTGWDQEILKCQLKERTDNEH